MEVQRLLQSQITSQIRKTLIGEIDTSLGKVRRFTDFLAMLLKSEGRVGSLGEKGNLAKRSMVAKSTWGWAGQKIKEEEILKAEVLSEKSTQMLF